MSHRVVLTRDLNLYFINRCRCVRGGSLIWLCWFFFIALLLHLPKYVCTVYFLMDALASVKLDNKSLLTKKKYVKTVTGLVFFCQESFLFHRLGHDRRQQTSRSFRDVTRSLPVARLRNSPQIWQLNCKQTLYQNFNHYNEMGSGD